MRVKEKKKGEEGEEEGKGSQFGWVEGELFLGLLVYGFSFGVLLSVFSFLRELGGDDLFFFFFFRLFEIKKTQN